MIYFSKLIYNCRLSLFYHNKILPLSRNSSHPTGSLRYEIMGLHKIGDTTSQYCSQLEPSNIIEAVALPFESIAHLTNIFYSLRFNFLPTQIYEMVRGYFTPYFGVGAGIEGAYITFDPINQTSGYQKKGAIYYGFGWHLLGGLVYKLGSKSSLVVEVTRDNCEISHDEKITGRNYRDTVNLSGMAFWIGIRLGSY